MYVHEHICVHVYVYVVICILCMVVAKDVLLCMCVYMCINGSYGGVVPPPMIKTSVKSKTYQFRVLVVALL